MRCDKWACKCVFFVASFVWIGCSTVHRPPCNPAFVCDRGVHYDWIHSNVPSNQMKRMQNEIWRQFIWLLQLCITYIVVVVVVWRLANSLTFKWNIALFLLLLLLLLLNYYCCCCLWHYNIWFNNSVYFGDTKLMTFHCIHLVQCLFWMVVLGSNSFYHFWLFKLSHSFSIFDLINSQTFRVPKTHRHTFLQTSVQSVHCVFFLSSASKRIIFAFYSIF